MPQKRLKEDPPPASSSSSEEEESDSDPAEEEEDQDDAVDPKSGDQELEDEDEDQNTVSRNPIVSSSAKPSKSSGKETESESESGSGSELDKTLQSPSASDFTIKPVTSKAVNDSPKPITSAGLKRPATSALNVKESKKRKKNKGLNNEEDENGKKGTGSSQRLWSENDEIAILQGMTDYQLTKGSDPYVDMGAFHEFIKKNLHVDVSKNQLMDKIRRLKKKYQINEEKWENGEEPVFSKPHEHKSFELSKKIWGVNGGKQKPQKNKSKVSSSKSLASPKQNVEQARKEQVNGKIKVVPEEFLSDYPWLNASFELDKNELWSDQIMHIVRDRIPTIGSRKAKELDERWRKLNESELEAYIKKVELIREQSKLVLDSMRATKF